MAISEIKMQMVIANYFKSECDTNTSIRQAFEKGFRIGAEKGTSMSSTLQWIPCKERMPKKEIPYQRRGYYLTTNAYGNVDLTRYEFEDDFQKTGWQSDIRIVAWMPLPKPYAERKDNE